MGSDTGTHTSQKRLRHAGQNRHNYYNYYTSSSPRLVAVSRVFAMANPERAVNDSRTANGPMTGEQPLTTCWWAGSADAAVACTLRSPARAPLREHPCASAERAGASQPTDPGDGTNHSPQTGRTGGAGCFSRPAARSALHYCPTGLLGSDRATGPALLDVVRRGDGARSSSPIGLPSAGGVAYGSRGGGRVGAARPRLRRPGSHRFGLPGAATPPRLIIFSPRHAGCPSWPGMQEVGLAGYQRSPPRQGVARTVNTGPLPGSGTASPVAGQLRRRAQGQGMVGDDNTFRHSMTSRG